MRIQEKKIILILIFISFTISSVFAQALPDSVIKRIDGLFSKWSNPNSPGCVIGIVRNDSLLYAKGYGLANLEYAIPNTQETIFHMASVSKQFTGYAIVLLAKQGKLALEDDVRKYLPWFPDLKEKITIRQLLNHTSGIRDQWQLLAISGTRIDDVITQAHIVKLLGQQRALNFKPGEQSSYSNSGYTMLAEIVKAVSGQTLRQFADSAIFKPLGMNNTHFHDDYTEVVKNRSYSYGRSGSNGFTNSVLSYSNAGATSLFTNATDMARWITNFYAPKVGTPSDIEQLAHKGKLNNGRELSYALGIVVDQYKGWKQYLHGGGDAGYRTFVTVFPDLKMGFMVFSNLGDFNPYARVYELADVFIKDTAAKGNSSLADAVEDSRAILNDTLSAKRFAGHYISDGGAQFDFTLRDRKLYWERNGRSDVLVKTEKDTFVVAQTPEVKFVFGTQGKGDTVVKQYWPEGDRVLEKYTPISVLSDKQLQAYTGTYYCPELDSKYTIVLKNGSLMLTHRKYEDTPLKLVGKNDLLTDFWWMDHLRVVRNSENRITGFDVNAGRIRHLRFNKID
jgi:CubicO group peptidase (beta-lactamase class C family)